MSTGLTTSWRAARRSARRMMAAGGTIGFVASPRVRAEPHALYASLRRNEPVHESPFGVVLLSSHADVSACVRSPRLGSDERKADQDWLMGRPLVRALTRLRPMPSGDGRSRDLVERLMLFLDPPDHTRLRSLVTKAFTPRAIAALEDPVRAMVDEMLDELAPAGRADLMRAFAYPLPARVICQLLGVPDDDHHFIVRLAPVVASRIDPGPMRGDDQVAAADRATTELTEYVDALVGSRRRCPGPDLLSALITAEEAGDRLSHDELVATVILLLMAGHETTANLIGNSVLTLMRHPAQVPHLLADPARAVEELLRFEGPIQMTQRITLDDFQVGDRRFPPGRYLILLLAAANRDPEVFERPGDLDLTRSPNPHVGFGGGAHFCLGAPLARLEARLALPAIVERLGRGRIENLQVDGPTPWRSSFTVRGLQALPLRWPA